MGGGGPGADLVSDYGFSLEGIPALPQLFARACEVHAGRPFQLRAGADGVAPLTFAEFGDRVRALATGLADLGVAPGDRVGLIAHNRPEWLQADLAVLCCGAADVPRGADLSPKELAAILGHAEVVGAFVEDAKALKQLTEVREALPHCRFVIVLSGDAPREGNWGLPLAAVLERGRGLLAQGDDRVARASAGVTGDTLATIIYTSGTSGDPKGVRLRHRNLLHNVATLPAVIELSRDDCYLSVLPAWHAFERMVDYVVLFGGASMAYSSPVRKIFLKDLDAIRPTILAAVPRLWEAMVEGAHANARNQGRFKHWMFRTLVGASIKAVHCRRRLAGTDPQPPPSGRRPAWLGAWLAGCWYRPLHALARRLIFGTVQARFGGRVHTLISGGGALPASVDDFFAAAGMPILEGYGLTETSPVLSIRERRQPLMRSVGRPLPDTEIKIVDEHGTEVSNGAVGKILARGPQVMEGYHKRRDLTEIVLSPEGWFDTGDLGLRTAQGAIRIVGRCKDTIVLRSGENVEPEPIEIRLRESPLIEHVVVLGQDEPVLGALVVPNADALAAQLGRAGATLDVLAGDAAALSAIQQAIGGLLTTAAGFKRHERVGKVRLLGRSFEVGRELTPTLKVRRPQVAKEYQGEIAALFKDAVSAE